MKSKHDIDDDEMIEETDEAGDGGFAELFEQLFCRSVLETYYFIRSDAEPESVRAGLAEILRLLALEALVGELPQAGQRYRQDLTLQNCFRVESLRSELAVSVAFFDDPD